MSPVSMTAEATFRFAVNATARTAAASFGLPWLHRDRSLFRRDKAKVPAPVVAADRSKARVRSERMGATQDRTIHPKYEPETRATVLHETVAHAFGSSQFHLLTRAAIFAPLSIVLNSMTRKFAGTRTGGVAS